MILLIEGPDFAGKTSIVDEIKRDWYRSIGPDAHTVSFRKMTHNENGKLPLLEKFIRASYQYDVNIWDRSYYPSDLIYNPIVKKEPSVLEAARGCIEHELLLAGAVVVFVTAQLPVLQARAVRGDEYIHTEQLSLICGSYARFLGSTPLPWVTIDTSLISKREAALQVADLIRTRLGGKVCK